MTSSTTLNLTDHKHVLLYIKNDRSKAKFKAKNRVEDYSGYKREIRLV